MKTRWLILVCLLVAVPVGAAAVEYRGVRLDVPNGARVRVPGSTTVYFVDRGLLRPVTLAAYRGLWRGWRGIGLVSEVPENLLGRPLEGSTRLVKTAGDRQAWLIDNGRTKRPVRSFTVTGFASSLVEVVEPCELDRYETDEPLD